MPWCNAEITGLVGVIAVTIYDTSGEVVRARTTEGITEVPSGSGLYFIDDYDTAVTLTYAWDYNGTYGVETIPARGSTPFIPEPEPETGVIDSILNSIKKLLNISTSATQFDSDLIILINSVFSTLFQLGVGPTTAFKITGDTEVWSSFIGARTDIELVKTYVYLKTRLVFDPPQTGYLVEAIKAQIIECEWRLNDWVAVEE